MRKTKIICTLGPAVPDEESLRALILAGMDAARFNFSHGTHESHLQQLNLLKKVRRELSRPVATILDTKGPEIRIRSFAGGSIQLAPGDPFILTSRDVPGSAERVSVTYPSLPREVSSGNRILLDDGLIELAVTEIRGEDILCTVINGGELSNNKSINIPDVHIDLPSLTDRDAEDLRFAAENGFDFIAASFIRKASDVEDIRRVLRQCGGEGILIIAKIENREGVDNMDDIIATSDAVMVARGDLGVEIPIYEVPILQKRIISKSIQRGKPVITATQMLDSMIRNPRPTRAEVSDIANAVFDGTSSVMLSGETASGKYPLRALSTMVRTLEAAEAEIDYWARFLAGGFSARASVTNAISHACCTTAHDLGADAIITVTTSGHTARMISRFKPQCAISAITTTDRVCRQLSISWGVFPILTAPVTSTDELFDCGIRESVLAGIVSAGDTVVITAGVPMGVSGTTNLIKAQVV
ncbi:pyruvate kinase [Papillibacter cinnamivorans]|uniref:Pyruvate kinase n=1 Tax=Papillibacter cinnamivorans DSM 12816 TaxID=1122930 RepID=A0A1W2A0F1_9FIRM|nr:pyruvate kinase [Papillibacter cinnamivorans]SMC54157.1 pyruvate kinase [Papillibacter cinnamivorans DSM 12816]